MDEKVNRIARMHFDEKESVLHIAALPDAVLDLKSVIEHFKMISEITNNQDHYALIDSTNSYTSTPDAMQYASRPEVLCARKAAAYFHPNYANRFQIMQLQIKMKAMIPTCAFKEKDEAMLWLRSLNLIRKKSLSR